MKILTNSDEIYIYSSLILISFNEKDLCEEKFWQVVRFSFNFSLW